MKSYGMRQNQSDWRISMNTVIRFCLMYFLGIVAYSEEAYVTTLSDIADGDTTSVSALMASPGSDGVSPAIS